jgi:hypothetical protein
MITKHWRDKWITNWFNYFIAIGSAGSSVFEKGRRQRFNHQRCTVFSFLDTSDHTRVMANHGLSLLFLCLCISHLFIHDLTSLWQ